jgi:hypothetical protein
MCLCPCASSGWVRAVQCKGGSYRTHLIPSGCEPSLRRTAEFWALLRICCHVFSWANQIRSRCTKYSVTSGLKKITFVFMCKACQLMRTLSPDTFQPRWFRRFNMAYTGLVTTLTSLGRRHWVIHYPHVAAPGLAEQYTSLTRPRREETCFLFLCSWPNARKMSVIERYAKVGEE